MNTQRLDSIMQAIQSLPEAEQITLLKQLNRQLDPSSIKAMDPVIPQNEDASPPNLSTPKRQPRSMGMGRSDRGDLSERVDELLWQDECG